MSWGKRIIRLALLSFACGCGVLEAEAADGLCLAGPDVPVTAPYRGLVYTTNDIQAIRTALLSESSNRKYLAEHYLKAAQWWVDRGFAGVDAMLPPDGSLYAFGIVGDPKNGKSWPRYGRSDDVCSLERPGEIKSPHTGDIYGIQKPGEPYYDSGDGWVDPETGTRYYFKGMWNCFAIWKMHEAVDDLSIAYMLTGDERCAELGLYMLDQFAGMRLRNPTNYGLIDNPHATDPGYGFFGFMGNIANDRMIFSALSFDLLAGSAYAQRSSASVDGLTVAQNIQQNYFDLFEPWQVERLQSFQNHAIAAYGALLSQALLFGDADDTRLGIDLGYAFFDSCINQDGDYYEMSGSYSRLGRRYGGLLLNLLSNYRAERYAPSANMPDPADYPYELQFGNNPLWYSVAVDMLYRHTVLGRHLQYGDAHADRDIIPGEIAEDLADERAVYLSLLYRQTSREDWRRDLAQRYWALSGLDEFRPATADVVRFGPAIWLEPPCSDDCQSVTEETEIVDSDLMPGKRLAIMRSGTGEQKRAFYICGGMGNSHAHDDKMSLIPYGEGMSLTGEYGYFYYGTPDFCGWGTRSIAHNMVVVNEDLPQPSFIHIAPWKRVPPADIKAFVPHRPAQVVEMANPGMWKNITDDMNDYRRTAWLVDLSDDAYYFVDIFQVIGGKTHDYAWHSPYLEPLRPDDGFSVSGVELETNKNVWVLAALGNEEFRDTSYNKPGQAWGERLLGESGRIRDLGIPGEKLGYSKWNPPPGNGYGFIYDIRSAETDDDWAAQWLLHDNKHQQRLHVLNYDGMTAVAGREPTLTDHYRQTVVVARRARDKGNDEPLHSRFVTVNEVGTSDQFVLSRVQRVATTGSTSEKDRVALAVEAQDGIQDTILVNRLGGESKAANGVVLNGHRAFVRSDALGAVSDMLLQEGTLLQAGDVTIEAAASAWNAEVAGVEFKDDGFIIELDALLPEGDSLRGSAVLFSRPGEYSHNTYYEVERVETDGKHSRLVFSKQRLILASIQVQSVNPANNTIGARLPCELVSLPQMNYFKGRNAVVVSGKNPMLSSRVVEFKDKQTAKVENAEGFKSGDRIAILAVQPGDRVSIPSLVSLNRDQKGRYEVQGNQDVTVTLPGKQPLKVSVKEMPKVLP